MTDTAETLPPMHAGEVLREEFLVPFELSAGKIAKAAGIPRTRIERIMREEVGISGDTAVRLGRVFGTSPQFWMNLQTDYEISAASLALGDDLALIARLPAVRAV